MTMLEKHYREALTGINLKIAQLLGRNDANLPHVIRRIEYQRMIKEQVKAALDALHAKEYETISEYLNEAYTDAFVGSVYTMHHQDMPLILPIDQATAVKAVTIDSKLKTDLYTALGVDVTRLKKSIAAEITRGIASSMLYDEIARNIKNASGISLRRAKTITRTEAGRVQEQAHYDSAQKAKSVGADVVKQWSAIRDAKTRDSHRMLDGQIREVDEPFEVNGHKGMHPHDFGVAEEDINCRCTMLTRARKALDADELKYLQETAAYHGLQVKDSKKLGQAQAKNVAEFKKKYLKAAETVENTGKSGIIEVELDELVPCLKDAKTGKLYDTTVRTIKDRNELRQYNKNNGWFINWNKVPADCTVSALSLKGNDVTQGLVAYKVDHENKAVFTHWVVSAPHNRGKDKQFTGVGGHLFSIMADASEKAGFGGFLYGQATSKDVLDYYVDKYGATPLDGLRFYIDEKAAHEKILDFYNFEREDE